MSKVRIVAWTFVCVDYLVKIYFYASLRHNTIRSAMCNAARARAFNKRQFHSFVSEVIKNNFS